MPIPEPLASIKLLELNGWEVIEVVRCEDKHNEFYANLSKDGRLMYLQIGSIDGLVIEKECPCCGRQELLDVLSDFCPECEEEWVLKKNIDDEYVKTNFETFKNVSDILVTIWSNYSSKLQKFFHFKKGDNNEHCVSLKDINS